MKFIKYENLDKDSNFIIEMSKKFNISPKIVEIIVNRGYDTEEKIYKYINIDKNDFLNPFDLKNMDLLVERINRAINCKERVLIFGDYDVDGISATFVMLKLLDNYGVKADFYLPNRFVDGYGLTNQVLDKIKSKYNPELIITVDCGISCYEEVEYAKQLGIDIVITDHHNIPDIIPNTIVVNPKLDNQNYSFNDLCGTGVAFKVAQAMLNKEEYEKLLPVVAIATIADIVSLTEENRLIVYKGLKLCSKYLPVGLKQLFLDNKIQISKPSSIDIAFKIAPKLNSSGRMGDAVDSLKLYLESDIHKSKKLIEVINNHNTKRQSICNDVYNDCKQMLQKYNISNLRAIILYSQNWDQGILGIVCSKLLEEYRRPVFLFSKINDELKGSGRSINEINIHNMLSSMQDILTTFGGHSVAAGLSLNIKNFEEFSKKINSYIFQNINDEIFSSIKYYDNEITVDDINDDLIKDIQLLEPCGANNQRPLFKIDSSSIELFPLKKCPQHCNILISKKISAIYFNYTNQSVMLKMCKNHTFLVEFQDLKNGVAKGNIKNYCCDFVLKDKVNSYIDMLKLSHLSYVSDKTQCEYISYPTSQLASIVANCNNSAFGTCFVCYNIETYRNFINNYDLSKVHDFQFCSSKNSSGFNTIFLFPEDLSFTKNYKNVVFLDSIIDSSIVNFINQTTTANIYIPIVDNFDKDLYDKLSLSRSDFAKTFAVLAKLENWLFSDIFDLYSTIFNKIKFKIPFNAFYFEFLVFRELNIVNFELIEGLYKLTLQKKNKRNLSESRAFNFVALMSKIK